MQALTIFESKYALPDGQNEYDFLFIRNLNIILPTIHDRHIYSYHRFINLPGDHSVIQFTISTDAFMIC